MTAQPVKRQKLTSTVSDELLALIVRGNYQSGFRLPAERLLAEQMGVSRTSLRDAVARLEVLGHLEVRQGDGIYVCEPTATHLTQPFQGLLSRSARTIADLHEFRRMIEPEVAAQAAERATDAHLRALRDNLELQRELAARQIKLGEADLQFHGLIAEMAGNEVVMLVLGTLRTMLAELREQSPGDQPQVTIAEHEAIVQAITCRLPEQARQAMLRHLGSVSSSHPARLISGFEEKI